MQLVNTQIVRYANKQEERVCDMTLKDAISLSGVCGFTVVMMAASTTVASYLRIMGPTGTVPPIAVVGISIFIVGAFSPVIIMAYMLPMVKACG